MIPDPRGEKLLTLLVAATAALLLLGLQVLESGFFLCDDNASHFLPAYLHAFESLVDEGEIPWLNQHQSLGGTFLAPGQTGVFLAVLYPTLFGFRLLDIDPVFLIDFLASLHLMFAALGMWWLLRYRQVSRALAFVLALTWALLPFAVVMGRSWVFVTYLVAYLPFQFLLLLRFLENPSARLFTALVVVKSLFLFTGYPHYLALAFFFEAVFLVLAAGISPSDSKAFLGRRVTAAILTSLVSVAMSAPLMLPLLQAKADSVERAGGLSEDLALDFSLPPVDFLRSELLLPKEGWLLGAGSTFLFYMGLPLMLATGFALRGRRDIGPWALAAAATGLLALLFSTRFYWLLLQLPVFDSLRWPFKGFPIAAFFLFPVAAQGAGLFIEKGQLGHKNSRQRLVLGMFWLNLVVQYCGLFPAGWRAPLSTIRLDRSVKALASASLLQPIDDSGRVAFLRAPVDEPSDHHPLRMGFLFATLTGHYQVQGYDPLLARTNRELIFRTYIDGEISATSYSWPTIRQKLDRCSARYLLSTEKSALMPILANSPGIRLLRRDSGLVLFENEQARPIVALEPGGEALDFLWRTNGLVVNLAENFPGGRLSFNVAPLANYRWLRNGEPQGSPDLRGQRPQIDLPPGAARVELRYIDPTRWWGLVLCAAAFVFLVICHRHEDVLLNRLGPHRKIAR